MQVFLHTHCKYQNSMDIDQIQAIASKLSATKKPVIIMPKNPDPDALGASLGLFQALKKLNKEPKIACSTKISKKYDFLQEYNSIDRKVESNCEFCVSFDLESEDISAISAERMGNAVKIKLTAAAGSIKLDSLKLEKKNCALDCIITISVPSLASLGDLYTGNMEIFKNLDVINIGGSQRAEKFGTLNISDPSMTASEMVFRIIGAMDRCDLDSKVSTALLSGIIAGTKNFQAENIGYGAFEAASKLMASGADRAEVIRYFKRSNLPFYIIECYGQIADSIGRADNLRQAISKIEEFAKKKRLGAAEKAVLLIMVAFFAAQNIRIGKNVQNEAVESQYQVNLPSRSIVYAVDKLPITSEFEQDIPVVKPEENAAVQVKTDQIENNSGTSLIRVEISDPKTLKVPDLGINANIQNVGLNDDGSVQVPSNEKDVAWYMFGSKPGEAGNAVILGHRDSRTNPNGVFRRLNDVKLGSLIEIIDINGNVFKFKVINKGSYEDSEAPMKEIFGKSEKKMLNLITCSGAWNASENNYSKRIVIYSELVE